MRLVLYLLLFILWPFPSATAGTPSTTNDSWLSTEAQRPGVPGELEMNWKGKQYVTPGKAERSRIVQAVNQILDILDKPDSATILAAAALLNGTGFRFSEYKGPEGHWLILEAIHPNAGAGYYLFRTGPLEKEIVLQAPHAVFDKHTDVITKDIFAHYSYRAAFFGDWLRYGDLGTQPYEDSPYDLAHNPDTLYQDISTLWLKRKPTSVFVQLHGFDEQKIPESKADFIVSSGSRRELPVWFENFVPAFSASLPEFPVRDFPAKIKVLGGTTNVQGKLIRKSGGRFLHIEISLRLRERMKREETTCRIFGKTLFENLPGKN